MSFVPGLGLVKGMALTLRRFFEPKVTIMYPEDTADDPAEVPRPPAAALRRVGHAQVRDLLPVRPGLPDRVHRHGRHRHEGPLPRPLGRRPRRTASGARSRRCGGPAGRSRTRPTSTSTAIDLRPVDEILEEHDHDPKEMLRILEATQEAYGYLPVAALKRISIATGAWYAMIYGTATYYATSRFEPPTATDQARRRRRPPASRRPRRRARPRRTGGRAATERPGRERRD